MAVDFGRDVYCVLGLPFDAVDMSGALQRVRDAAAQRRPCVISTPNTNFLIGCRSDSQFRDSVVDSDLSLADGMPLVWLARLLGMPIRERVAGSALFERLQEATVARLSVYFFGGGAGTAEAACRRLNAAPSGIVCAGFETPGFGSVQDMSGAETMAKINASEADFLLVSLAARKGQAWIHRNRAQISVPVISCLGATLNFVAGTVARAPPWMRRAGLEWLWRIKEEPALWRRYFGDGLALLGLLATRVVPHLWFLRRHRPGPDQLAAAGADTSEQDQCFVVRLRGAWSRQNLAPLRVCFAGAAQAGKDIRLEMGEVTYVDGAFIALVMLLRNHQALHRRQLLIAAPRKPVRQVIRYCCAEYLCPDPA